MAGRSWWLASTLLLLFVVAATAPGRLSAAPKSTAAPKARPGSGQSTDRKRIRFGHKVSTVFRGAEFRVRGLPAEDLFEWRIIFQKHFRAEYDTDLVDHSDTVVNPYVFDVNYRNRRVPRNVEINQGNATNFNIEVNRAAYNFLGFAGNRGFIVGLGPAVEKIFPFRTSDRHFGVVNAMMRLTDQQSHAFDFVLSGARSQVIDHEHSTHYGGTIRYTYYGRKQGHLLGPRDVLIKLPFAFYGYAITDHLKREADNTALENVWLDRAGPPYSDGSQRVRVSDISTETEARKRDAWALQFEPGLHLRRLGLELKMLGFWQQEENKETALYSATRRDPLRFREDGVGYKTRYIRSGMWVQKAFGPFADVTLYVGAAGVRVRRIYQVSYAVDLDPTTLQPAAPIPTGLGDILPDCGSRLSGLTERFECRRASTDGRVRAWIQVDILRVFVKGLAARPGQPDQANDRMYFRLQYARHLVGRDPRTNLFSEAALNKLIFPNDLTALPLGSAGVLERRNTTRPAHITRHEVRLDMGYELMGFDFAETVP